MQQGKARSHAKEQCKGAKGTGGGIILYRPNFLNMKVLRPEVQACLKSNQPGQHGVFDLMDDMFLSFYNLTDNEFDFMLEHVTEEEEQIIVQAIDSESFSLKRKSLEIRNKYLKLFNGTDGINNLLGCVNLSSNTP